MAIKDIAIALVMAQGTVRSAIKVAKKDGLKVLAPKPTGRAVGQKHRLTAEQALHIQRLICKNRPERLKLNFALWSRATVLLLVQQEFGIELPIRTMGPHHAGVRTSRPDRQQGHGLSRVAGAGSVCGPFEDDLVNPPSPLQAPQ